ncbi:magnesium transporter [Sulfurovum sp. NBC37-1]|uniref:magnesium transporter n=1 Tax=Sulfurovum sp. (strain NBC37-1) TaxID=387093 RepID=UPI0001587D96|nr:magnesium transporter [Sulfurovum sp. NBC37-1]BAF72336.1 magnesium transporter [Sulfurovum sp. NBC37-1]
MSENIPAVQQFETLLQSNHVASDSLARMLLELAYQDYGLFFTNLSKVPKDLLAEVILALPLSLFKEAVSMLPHKKLADVISYLESDKATDFIQRLERVEPQVKEAIYPLLHPNQQEQISRLSQYRSDEAGAYMQTELLWATTDEHIAEIKEKLRVFKKHKAEMPLIKLFVTDKEGHLVATVHFSDLLLFEDEKTLAEVIDALPSHKPLSVRDHTLITEVTKLFREFDLAMVAVVDSENRLQGCIVFDDIYDLIFAEEEAQAFKMSGTKQEAEEESLQSAQRHRLKWIFINLGAILIAASVVNFFRETIEQIVVLAVMMPVIAALGGNVGNQAVTVTVRRLALGETSWQYAKEILAKEIYIGVINGVIIGLIVGTVAYFWFQIPMLGVVIGLAIIINLSIAGLLGSLLPLTFKHFDIDPAIASPLLLTTATDAIGFFVFLGLAKIMLF